MAIMRVNPTRMELKRLKNRLKTAERGHKLLKDKTDEMVRQFIIYANRNRRLRKELERELGDAMKNFVLARAVMSPCQAEEALVYPSRTVTLACDKKSVMSVMVPSIKVSGGDGALYPYGFLSVTDEMDSSIATLNTLLVKLIELAEVEKTTNMLADEIEKNKRRVNALEHVMIPQLRETIKYIVLKLEENERGSLVRLMKVKDMIAERQ
ncbi:MAG TPA: V-type ATP synthase subunit D [Firmicutes bacterium]|nr:V-type ATP synthase subunit D [Bacillota bacterium]